MTELIVSGGLYNEDCIVDAQVREGVMRSGRSGGNADTAAAVRFLLDVCKHALRASMRLSGSLI